MAVRQGQSLLKTFYEKWAGKKLPSSGHSIQRTEMLKKTWIQRLWLVLAILDLIRIYGFCVRWWLFQGKSVLCDRYLWDTLIDFKIMFPNINIEKWFLWKCLVWCTPIPTNAFLLMIPLELSKERCLKKYDPFPDASEIKELRYAIL